MYGMKIANSRVATAITPSARIMIFLRGYLSAQTPEKKEMTNCGAYAAMVSAETHTPDDVCRVTYHMIANWTMDEPSSVTPWLARNSAAPFF